VAENRDTVIAFNGEIYNHLELRASWSSRGRRFRTRSDTETVLQAFLEWDTGCFARMRGMFAVALVDRIQLASGAGARPHGHQAALFRPRGEDLYFGSELKAIFVHPEIDRTLSLDGLDCFLSLNYVPCSVDAGGGNRKAAAGRVAGMAERVRPHESTGSCPSRANRSAMGRIRARGAGPPAQTIHGGALDCRRAAGYLA
jgi:asparagine synthase (glutamine-hydrolysing)